MASTTEKVVLQVGSSAAPTIAISVNVTFTQDTEDIWTVSGNGFEYVAASSAETKHAALIGWLSKILGVAD